MEGHDTRPWQAFQNRALHGRGWSAYGESRTGSKRASNEDNYVLAPLAHDRLLVAVADGLGGHNAGQVASRLACETLFDAVRNGTLDAHDDSDQSILHALESTILEAHQRIALWSKDIKAFEGMGCTFTAAIVAQHRAWYCHVGDSRLYHIGSATCVQITDDHTVTGDNFRDGQPILQNEERRGGDPLVQALGIEEKYNRLMIEQGAIEFRGGDSLLLCSDGLYRCLAEQRLAESVRSHSMVAARVQQLVGLAAAAGGGDDITVVLVAMPVESLEG